ncbi:amidohydrolase family protein, partial [candidate division WOR-3 bacterium]|nr:amidohydrolase family protein [candidate division WOR-3 bacterium]
WIDRLISNGITSLEIKSGYGLDTETELKQLRVIKKLKNSYPINIKATFLGAHEIPLEYRNNRRVYIDKIKNEMIPAVSKEGLADYIDIFCEKGVYTFDETMEILEEGLKYSLEPRIHADEMEPSGGSTAAALLKAISVDHMNVPLINDLKVLAKNRTVITLLPATNFILNIKKSPPIKEMRKSNNIIAVSTDFNPGSSPVSSIALTASIGMIRYGLSSDELIYAITLNPAFSLGLSKTTGSIEEGKDADILIHSVENIKQLFYFVGMNSVKKVIIKGEPYLSE